MAIVLNGTTGIANDGGYTGDGVVFADTTPANTLVTTTGGNVGIGTSSPTDILTVSGSARIGTGTTTPSLLTMYPSASAKGWQISANNYVASALEFTCATANGGTTFTTPSMLLDSSGRLLVGITTSPWSTDMKMTVQGTKGATFISTGGASAETMACWNIADSGTRYQIYFGDSAGGGIRGSISTNGSSTTYSTSSDYRLKEAIAPMTGALAMVTLLKPVTYKWKVDGSDGRGFIAHELQEVVPECVVGEKDAVDAEGNPVYQGIDTSFLVATLTAAIQEQQAIITALTARVTALEGQP